MKTIVEARTNVAPDLYLLGVPDSVHSRTPNANYFPTNLNPELRKSWDRLFKDKVFAARLAQAASTDEQWNLCIKSVLAKARAENINPFQPHYLESDNGKISASLSSHRKHIHALLEKCGLHQVGYASATPSVKRRKSGFALTVSCKLRTKGHAYADVKHLSTSLKKHGFIMAKTGIYEHAVNPEAYVRVDTRKPQTVLSYDICCARHPFIKSWNVVTKAKYNSFVISKLWKPLVKASPASFTRFGV